MPRPLLMFIAAMAVPAAVHAQKADEPIACVFSGTGAGDMLAAIAARSGRRARQPTEAEEAAMDRLAESARACRSRYGWTDGQAAAAVTYALGRVGYEREVQGLAARGLDAGFIDDVAADLGEQGIAALVAGEDSPENLEYVGNVVTRHLEAAGYRIPPGSPEWATIGGHIGRGLSSGVARDRAVAAFARP